MRMEEVRLFRTDGVDLVRFKRLWHLSQIPGTPSGILKELGELDSSVRFRVGAAKLLRAFNAFCDFEIEQ